MTERRTHETVLALFAFTACVLGVTRTAWGGVLVGEEMAIGTLEAGPTNAMPKPVIVRDGSGVVAAYVDQRVPLLDERQLFVERLDDTGLPTGDAVVVSGDATAFAVFGTPAGALLFWSEPPAVDPPRLHGAFVLADGALEPTPIAEGLAGLPSSFSCLGDRCLAVVGAALQWVDLGGEVGELFDVAATDATPLGTPVVASLDAGYLSVRAGTQGEATVFLAAAFSPDGELLRPYTTLAPSDSKGTAVRLIAGSDGYLFGFTRVRDDFRSESLGTMLLASDGVPLTEPSTLPLGPLGYWDGIFTGSAYQVVVGESPQRSLRVALDGTTSSPLDLALDTERSLALSGLVTANETVLVGFGPTSSVAQALDDPPLPNLARLGADGDVAALMSLGLRPNQASSVRLVASRDRLLAVYEERTDQEHVVLRYSLRDAEGRELGIDGRVDDYTPSTYQSVDWSVSSADSCFLLAVEDAVLLVDPAGVVTRVPVELPEDPSRTRTTFAQGGGVLFALSNHRPDCPEDCFWTEVSLTRYGLDGAPLDDGPIFGPSTGSRLDGQGAVAAVWNGEALVATIVTTAGVAFRRVGADGALLDEEWRYFQGVVNPYSVTSQVAAVFEGTTFVAFGSDDGIQVGRIETDGTVEPAPVNAAPLGFNPGRIVLTHDGERLLVGWELAGGLVAATLGPSDVAEGPFLLVEKDSAIRPHEPSLASLGDGRAFAAYHRFDASAKTSRVALRLVTDGPSEVVDAGVPDAGAADAADAGDPGISCSDDSVCPANFTCDEEAQVCIPPPATRSAERHRTGCGCRLGARTEAQSAGLALLSLLVLSRFARRRRPHRRFGAD